MELCVSSVRRQLLQEIGVVATASGRHPLPVFRGAKLETRFLHRERRRCAADQDELIGVSGKVFSKDVESPHQGKRSFNSFSASWTRSSVLPCRLSVRESGSTVSLSGKRSGL